MFFWLLRYVLRAPRASMSVLTRAAESNRCHVNHTNKNEAIIGGWYCATGRWQSEQPVRPDFSILSLFKAKKGNVVGELCAFPTQPTGGRVWFTRRGLEPFQNQTPGCGPIYLTERISPNAGLAGCDIPPDLTRPGRKELLKGTKYPLQRAFKFRPTQKDRAYSSTTYSPSPPIVPRHRLTASN